MNDAKGQSPADLQSTISGYRTEAEQQFKAAQALSVPDQMVGAHRSLLEVLEFRRDGLDAIASPHHRRAERRRRGLRSGDPDIAGQMPAFLASDVIYDARVVPLIKKGLKDGDAGDSPSPPPSSCPASNGSARVLHRRQARRPGGPAGGGRQRRPPPAPGLHGTGRRA